MDAFFITIITTKYTKICVIEEGEIFSASGRRNNLEFQTLWNFIIKHSNSIYTGLANRIIVAQGCNLGRTSIRMASPDGTDDRTEIYNHYKLSSFEIHHAPIIFTVRKILMQYQKEEFD